MKVVTLVSGGLDSTVMSIAMKRNRIQLVPLFIDYGQRARLREWKTAETVHRRYKLPKVRRVELRGLGQAIRSGLTDKSLHIFSDAFFPGRNLYFLLVGASVAVQENADGVAIGLLSEEVAQFPDQTKLFVEQAEGVLSVAMGRSIKVLAPLMDLEKKSVVRLATEMKIKGTYSCHAGTKRACGVCIACREYL